MRRKPMRELAAYIRYVSDTVYHPCCQVLCAEGLNIVDASIFPSLPTVNTNSAVIMAAERACDVLR